MTTAPPPQPQGAPTQRRRDTTGDNGGGAEEVVEGPHSPAGMSASLPHSPATPSTPWSVGNGAGAAPASAQGNPVAARSTTSLPSLMMNPYLPQPSGTARPQDPLASCRIPHSVIPVVVTDFGLAIVQEAHRRAGRGGGTKPYIAPECWRGQTCTASDIWSLGCVLYALATARLTARTVRIMSNEAKRDGFASMVLNDILEHNYSLAFASFVVSLLVVDPAKRPTAAMAEQCFVVNEETGTVAFDPTCPFFSNVLDL